MQTNTIQNWLKTYVLNTLHDIETLCMTHKSMRECYMEVCNNFHFLERKKTKKKHTRKLRIRNTMALFNGIYAEIYLDPIRKFRCLLLNPTVYASHAMLIPFSISFSFLENAFSVCMGVYMVNRIYAAPTY